VDFDTSIRKPLFDDYTSPEATIDSISPPDPTQGEEVNFQGYGTAYESIDRYVWESDLDGELHNDTTSGFSIDSLSNGSHTISFRVEDNYGVWSEPDTTTLTVNGRPKAEIQDIWPSPGETTDTFYFSGTGTDDGEVVAYSWVSSIDGELYNGTESNFENSSLSEGLHTIYFKVQDDKGAWSEEVTQQLQVINPEPWANIDSIWPNPALDTDTVNLWGWGGDNGEVVRYVWKVDGNEVYNGTEEAFQHDPLPTGSYTIAFRVMDEHGAWSEEVSETLIVHERPVAYINDISPDPALTTDTVRLSGGGTDDGNITRYHWRSSRDGALSGTSTRYDHRFFMGNDFTLSETQGEAGELFIEADYEDYGFMRANRQWVDVGSWTFVSPDSDLTIRGSMLLNIHYIIIDEDFDAEPQFRFTLTSGGFPVAQREGNEGSPTPGVPEVYALSAYPDTIFLPAGTELVLELEYIGWENATLYLDNQSYESFLMFDRVETVQSSPELDVTGLSVGEHEIYLSVVDEHGAWSEEVSRPLLIHERPEAEIKAITPSPALDTDTVRFRAKGKDDGEVERYHWTSSLDEELYNGTEYAAMITDLAPGEHIIYLELMDNYGVWSEIVETTLLVHTRPVAEIVSIIPGPAPEGKRVTFTASGTDDNDITRYAWRTGEKELYNGTETNVSYSELPVGTHTIYLKVMDEHGAWSDEVSETLIIHERPTAGINAISPEFAIKNKRVEFRAVGTDDGGIQRYVWTSSQDGELYNGSEASFTISNLSLGEHNITLLVQDDDGAWSEEVTDTLVVKEEETDDDFFLVKKAGPLPVYGYLLIVVIGIAVGLFAFTRLGGEVEEEKDPSEELPTFQAETSSPEAKIPSFKQEEPLPPGTPSSREQHPVPGVLPTFKPDVEKPKAQEQKTRRVVKKKVRRVKKRAAPGAWTCPECTTKVGAKYPFCVECGEKKPSQTGKPSETKSPAGTWTCPKCTTKVGAKYPFCVECGEKKP